MWPRLFEEWSAHVFSCLFDRFYIGFLGRRTVTCGETAFVFIGAEGNSVFFFVMMLRSMCYEICVIVNDAPTSCSKSPPVDETTFRRPLRRKRAVHQPSNHIILLTHFPFHHRFTTVTNTTRQQHIDSLSNHIYYYASLYVLPRMLNSGMSSLGARISTAAGFHW